MNRPGSPVGAIVLIGLGVLFLLRTLNMFEFYWMHTFWPLLLIALGVWMARQGGYISDYDSVVGEKLAYVLSGGRLTGTPQVSEQYLLDLEREAFLSLIGTRKTQDRIVYMLKTGKPLRN